jgi:hypothetical protein
VLFFVRNVYRLALFSLRNSLKLCRFTIGISIAIFGEKPPRENTLKASKVPLRGRNFCWPWLEAKRGCVVLTASVSVLRGMIMPLLLLEKLGYVLWEGLVLLCVITGSL